MSDEQNSTSKPMPSTGINGTLDQETIDAVKSLNDQYYELGVERGVYICVQRLLDTDRPKAAEFLLSNTKRIVECAKGLRVTN